MHAHSLKISIAILTTVLFSLSAQAQDLNAPRSTGSRVRKIPSGPVTGGSGELGALSNLGEEGLTQHVGSGPVTGGSGGVGAIRAPGKGGVTDQALTEMNKLRQLSDIVTKQAEVEVAEEQDRRLEEAKRQEQANQRKQNESYQQVERLQLFLIRYFPLLTAISVSLTLFCLLWIGRSAARIARSCEGDVKKIGESLAEIREKTKSP